MRLRWHYKCLVLAAISVYWSGAFAHLIRHGKSIWQRFENRPATPNWRLAKAPESLLSMVFPLEKDKWIEFVVPPDQQLLRLVTNAELPVASRGDQKLPLPDDVEWPYAFQYQLLDSRGKVVVDRDYHQITRLTEFQDEKTKETIQGMFYIGHDLIACDGRSLVLNLAETGLPVTRLRVRLKEAAEPLTGVVVRVYQREATSEHKLRYLWQRLYEGRQQKLARSNVYSPDMLSEDEKRNLLRDRWIPIAPEGIGGIDYQQRDLYVLIDNDDNIQWRTFQMPAGIWVDRDHRAVIPLPEEGGRFRFTFQAIQPKAVIDPEDLILLFWQGKGLSQRASYTVPWNGRQAQFDVSLDGGIVEIQGLDSFTVRADALTKRSADRKHGADNNEITPDPIYIWSYLLTGNFPVDFEVLHTPGSPTPFRVDLRQMHLISSTIPGSDVFLGFTPQSVAFELLDAEGRTIHGGELLADQPPSLYDRLVLFRQECPLSEFTSYFFSLPNTVARIRFRPTSASVLVSAYNRPGDLPRLTTVPDDYYRFNREELDQRSWFLLRAEDHERLVMEKRCPLLMLQTRPTPDSADILLGRYHWEDFLPDGNWRGRQLLAPREPDAPFNPDSLPVLFVEVPRDKKTQVAIMAQPGRQEIPLVLAYDSPETESMRAELFIDDRLHYSGTVEGSRGEVALPPYSLRSSPKPRTIRIASSRPARFFLNYVDPEGHASFLRRMAIVLGRDELAFDYDKVSPDQEILSFTVFQPLGASEKPRIRIRINQTGGAALGPFLNYFTFRDRIFEVTPGQQIPQALFGTEKNYVDQGQSFFFPVGVDLKPGRCRVRVQKEQGPECYLVMSRTTPGAYDRRDVFIEPPSRPRSKPTR